MSYKIVPHPESGVPLVDLPHGRFGVGCQPRSLSAFNDRFPPPGEQFPVIPPARWTEQDFRADSVPVQDQGQSSACCAASLIEVMGGTLSAEDDFKVELSMWWAYGQLNRGRDAGANIPDALWLAQTRGVPRASLVQPGNLFGPYGAEANADAGDYKIELAYDVVGLAAIASALERQQWCLIGIDIGGDFSPDEGGFLAPYRPSPKGVLGHAISVCGKKYERGLWWPLIQNHWTRDWGQDGFAYLHPSYLVSAPAYGSWAARMARQSRADPNRPPVAKK